nr:MAG TPA: CDI toxin-like protein [Caudoviricetes sp.]
MGKSSGGIRNANKPKSKISKDSKEEARERELQKLNAPYREIYKAKNGASVMVSPYADRKDLQENITTAKVIADELGVSVKIRPHLILEGYKNPEYEIKGIVGDRAIFEGTDLRKFVSNTFKNKYKDSVGQLSGQRNSFLVLDIGNKPFTESSLIGFGAQINSKMTNRPTVEHIYIVKGDKAIVINRNDVGGNNLFEKILSLNK